MPVPETISPSSANGRPSNRSGQRRDSPASAICRIRLNSDTVSPSTVFRFDDQFDFEVSLVAERL